MVVSVHNAVSHLCCSLSQCFIVLFPESLDHLSIFLSEVAVPAVVFFFLTVYCDSALVTRTPALSSVTAMDDDPHC